MSELEEKVKEILMIQGRINAVKYYHEETGVDLSKSKEYIDSLAMKYGVKDDVSADYGCFITALLFILGISVGLTLFFKYDNLLWAIIVILSAVVICAVRSGHEEKRRTQKDNRRRQEINDRTLSQKK